MMPPNINLGIIIPYFQREAGILRKVVLSVVMQKQLPESLTVEVVIIDDGSPIPPDGELTTIMIPSNTKITILKQTNSGCAAARNTGLNYLSDATHYIAFLDSDDEWHDEYLATALNALATGADLFFCDNERPCHHLSQFFSNRCLIKTFIDRDLGKTEAHQLSSAELTSLILKDFPAQLSTVTYRRSVEPRVRFDESVKTAGEDMLFLLHVSSNIHSAIFSDKVMVTCGVGINMYFGHLGWDSPGHMRQVYDRMLSHTLIAQQIKLVRKDREWNQKLIATLRRKFVYLSIRHIIQKRGRLSPELIEALGRDKLLICKILCDAPYVLIGRALRMYHPV